MANVTISIPIYNAEKYLHDSIQSVLNQTYRDWILYLINDGSTDDSLSIMQEFAEKDDRIIIVNDGFNRGLIARLNQSIELCTSKYYARMDADDIMSVFRIEEQVRFLEEHSDIDVCGTSIMTIDDKNNIIGSGFNEGKTEGFIHPTVMGKTTWFKSNPYEDWAIRAEDFELWTRTSVFSNFYTLGKPLLFYREFGVPTYKKYCLSQRTLVRIASKYKEYGKPFSWFVKQTLFAFLKILLSSFLNIFGKIDIVVLMRRRKPIPENRLLNKSDLEKAIQSY